MKKQTAITNIVLEENGFLSIHLSSGDILMVATDYDGATSREVVVARAHAEFANHLEAHPATAERAPRGLYLCARMGGMVYAADCPACPAFPLGSRCSEEAF